jgi:hypothetical protein
MASASCDASADCQAQASAQANASLECTPPSVDLSFNFAANVDASAQADFMAHIAELKVRGAAILQGFTKYTVLLKGKTDASGNVIVNSPITDLGASLQGLAASGPSIAADIPIFRLTCALSAFSDSVNVLSNIVTTGATSFAAQGTFATAFTSGFSS